MQTHEFFHQYANTPLADRFKMINFVELGSMTLNDVYQRVKAIEDKIRPDVIERDNLIRHADWFMNHDK